MKKETLGKYLLVIFFFTLSCKSHLNQDSDLNNLSYKELIVKKGKPVKENIIELNKFTDLYEYQSNLYNLLKNQDTIMVKELEWKEGNIKTIIWLIKDNEQWVSIDNLSWDFAKLNL